MDQSAAVISRALQIINEITEVVQKEPDVEKTDNKLQVFVAYQLRAVAEAITSLPNERLEGLPPSVHAMCEQVKAATGFNTDFKILWGVATFALPFARDSLARVLPNISVSPPEHLAEAPPVEEEVMLDDQELDLDLDSDVNVDVRTKSRRYRSIRLSTERDHQIDLNAFSPVARITIASPERILQWARRNSRAAERRIGLSTNRFDDMDLSNFGEVKKPETINYRTLKPEKDGLFCERIFGPVLDWECTCGKYKRIKYKGIVCDRCGVEVIESKVRRTRMGHIKLAAPVTHIWFYKGTTSPLSRLLDIPVKELGKVIYFQNFIVIDPGDSPLKEKQILTDDEVRKYREVYGGKIDLRIGAEAVREMLRKIDMEQLSARLTIEMRQATSVLSRNKIIKRLKIVEAFRGSDNDPQWMVMEVLPVIPPELRPLVHLDGGRFATSDLNDLYRRVINRNNRLKKLTELKAPETILRNEKRMLQEAVDALLYNSARTRPTKGHNNRPLKSLTDMLRGNQGRFRQSLRGKRVDYSGSTVAVVDPILNFNECGLPEKMAFDLFDPFIIRELEARGYVNTIKAAKKMMERKAPEVYDILEDILLDHPVLLGRANPRHHLAFQAFMPRLVKGKAMHVPPMALTALNAATVTDSIKIFIPLSTEAKLEAVALMMAQNNIISPLNGRPLAVPTGDMVAGLFSLTSMVQNPARHTAAVSRRDRQRLVPAFGCAAEAISASAHGAVTLQEKIVVRIVGKGRIITTAGRLLFMQALPKELSCFDGLVEWSNIDATAEALEQLVAAAHRTVGGARTARMLDDLKRLGLDYCTKSGFSLSALGDNANTGAQYYGTSEEGAIDLARQPARQGRSSIEIFQAAASARKTKLFSQPDKDSSSFLKRLNNAAHHLIITEEDCLASTGINIQAVAFPASSDDAVAKSLRERITGRFALADIADPKTGVVLVEEGELISSVAAVEIESAGNMKVSIRSVVTCATRHGVCGKCYGLSLITGREAMLGEAVGVLAAQSLAGVYFAYMPGKASQKNDVSERAGAGKEISDELADLFEPKKGPSRLASQRSKAHAGDQVSTGDFETADSDCLHRVLAADGPVVVAEHLLARAQVLCARQGVELNDKHIECIVRQMLQMVVVEQPGDSRYVFDQLIDHREVEDENLRLAEQNVTPATYRWVLQGLKKCVSNDRSFIASATTQPLAKTLTKAAIRGQFDHLRGMTETVCLGLLIGAGTGMPIYRNIHVKPAKIIPPPAKFLGLGLR